MNVSYDDKREAGKRMALTADSNFLEIGTDGSLRSMLSARRGQGTSGNHDSE